MKKILWLTSWYPNKLEPLSGDFIERHAKAASLKNNITVIHVVKDHRDVTAGNFSITKIEYPDFPNLTAYVGYYKSRGGWLAPASSLVRYFSFLLKIIKNEIAQHGKPDLVNVHICFKAGLGALFCKWKLGIKYVVSEQWTIFSSRASPSFKDQRLQARLLIRLIYRHAEMCTAVSDHLSQCMKALLPIKKPVRIPNVVDRSIFHHSESKHRKFSFIHVSVLNYQKNVEAIIEAVRLLSEKTTIPFRLIIYGPQVDAVRASIRQHKLEDFIDYRHEVLQEELAAEMKKCHSLILYSRFETFGCVVIEAMACGLPVVVSDIPPMRELVEENVSGVFAGVEQPSLLAEKMWWVMNNYHSFDHRSISERTQRDYSFETVADSFDNVFRNFSSPTPTRLRQE